MKRALYEQWLKALETAPKTVGRLKDDRGMCCLGVLCTLVPKVLCEKSLFNIHSHTFSYEGHMSRSALPHSLAKELGIDFEGCSSKSGHPSLSEINDNNTTFEPVIQALRETPELYFNIED